MLSCMYVCMYDDDGDDDDDDDDAGDDDAGGDDGAGGFALCTNTVYVYY